MPAFRAYRAPSANGAGLIDPPLIQADAVAQANRALAESYPGSLRDLRRLGRDEVVRAALAYTSAYRDVHWTEGRDPGRIIMAGHQPTLFHPGVWFKNFALSHLAACQNSLAINLVVDNDVAGDASVRVPVYDDLSRRVGMQSVAFDRAASGVPYEQWRIADRALFDSFSQRLAAQVQPLVTNPSVTLLWRHAKSAIQRCDFAGCVMAQARHALEADLGARTLELPVSVVSRTEAFARFIVRIFDRAAAFAKAYNDSLAVYRAAQGIRSRSHPVPPLGHEDGWQETPLWIYGNDLPVRRAVWVRRQGDRLEISDRAGVAFDVDMSNLDQAADQLRSQCNDDVKLRPRALLTTMFARLVLSDLFLHGIGGGKYDQLGDMVAAEFFALTPPQFMVLSATIRLPIAEEQASAGVDGEAVRPQDSSEDSIAFLQRQLRQTVYQPERFAGQADLSPELLHRKASLLESIPPRGQKLDWHRQVTDVNQRLSDELAGVRHDLNRRIADAKRIQANQSILRSREHSLALHPVETMLAAYRRLLQA
ncbi:hypothetical protein [Crateriforma spongiae]|uniref:hypothetical protein n=1 Tax=Crateriforma spongiae TaxID=2724528 RepID=UPI0014457E10|nr:hypothetical protein [Crateriforma spongiae]